MSPPRPMAALGALVVLALLGCSDDRAATSRLAPASILAAGPERHPLLGTIWSTAEGRAVSPGELNARAAAARFVLLGERHGNPEHHRLQAEVLDGVIRAGRRPAVAFEMIPVDLCAALEAQLRRDRREAEGIGDAVAWEARGWPAWSLYRPIAQLALDAGLPIIAADLPRRTMREVSRRGILAVDPDLVGVLRLPQPIPAAMREQMTMEMRLSHCGVLDEEAAGRLATAQLLRDAYMAYRLGEADDMHGDGAVLITGAGHARRDRGVPWHLVRQHSADEIVSIAFVEVEPGRVVPADYADGMVGAALPFDFVWFTSSIPRKDPCSAHAEQLRRLGRGRD